MAKRTKVLMECAEWLSTCLKLGWAKTDLDALEALWWKYHDDNGGITVAAPKEEPHGE